MHENSETIKGRDGQWYNVYDGTPFPLPQLFGFEKASYPTEEEASNKAAWRSQLGEGHYAKESPKYGFTESYQPSPQAKALGKVIEVLNDPRNAWIGMGPLAGVVKGPGWGAEALRRYKLLGGTPETLDKTLMRRGVGFVPRRDIVGGYRQGTDLAAPSGGTIRTGDPRELYWSTLNSMDEQADAMKNAGTLLRYHSRGLRGPYHPRVDIARGPRGDFIESAAPGNAAYGAVSRQVARMLDTPGFYLKRAEDLPTLPDQDYVPLYKLDE